MMKDRPLSKTLATMLAGCAMLLSASAHGFGAEGHAVVALLADPLLSPATRVRVDAILALEPGATLASVASWADQSRDRTTYAWHYVNMPRDSDCEYVAVRDCPGDDCVVGALDKQLHRLETTTGSEQLEALKYVVHFVGDLHQPLHAGYADDKGGNTYQLQAFGQGTNLHSLWDSGMLRSIDPGAESVAATLRARPAPPGSVAFAPAQWAKESCLIVHRADFYPADRTLGNDYVATFGTVLMDRLSIAGIRLAATLDGAFDPVAK